MNNQEISDAVKAIVAAIPDHKTATPAEAAAIVAGVALVTNLLQNINAIALHASHPPYMVTVPDSSLPSGNYSLGPKPAWQP